MDQNTVLGVMDELVERVGVEKYATHEPTPLICALAEEMLARGRRDAASGGKRTELEELRAMVARAGILVGLFEEPGGAQAVMVSVNPGARVALVFDDRGQLTAIESR